MDGESLVMAPWDWLEIARSTLIVWSSGAVLLMLIHRWTPRAQLPNRWPLGAFIWPILAFGWVVAVILDAARPVPREPPPRPPSRPGSSSGVTRRP